MSHGEYMLRTILINDWVMRREENASRHINMSGHYSDDTLLDQSGKLIKIIKLAGLDYITKNEQTLDAYKNRRNNLLKNFSSEFALYFWEVRRKISDYPGGSFVDSFAKYVNDKYQEKITKTALYHTDLYLAVMTKQPEGFINKGFNFLQLFNYTIDKAAKKNYLSKRHQKLNDVTRKILSTLSDYQCELLSVYEKKGIQFSAPLQFLSRLMNFDACSVPLQMSDAAHSLLHKRPFFNRKAGTLELR